MNDPQHNPSRERELSRRECLGWLARASALALSGMAARAWGGDGAGGGEVKIANLIKIANESALKIEKPSVFVSRTSKGVACLSTTCTHKNNTLELDGDGCIYCPVHNSTFDLEGNPSGGPATRPLTWYQTRVANDGAISVDTSRTVKQGEWAELPGWARPKKK